MKIVFAAVLLMIACLVTVNCYGQSTNRYQSVGGDYGKSVIGTLKTKDAQTAAEKDNTSSLWSWGSAPKGSLIIDNNLISDPRYSARKLNVTNNWLGDSFVDPYGDTPEYSYTDSVTGEPVKTYIDQNTGQSYYVSKDSKTGKLVYIYFNPATGAPIYTSFTPISGQYIEQEESDLPPVFNSNYPFS